MTWIKGRVLEYINREDRQLKASKTRIEQKAIFVVRIIVICHYFIAYTLYRAVERIDIFFYRKVFRRYLAHYFITIFSKAFFTPLFFLISVLGHGTSGYMMWFLRTSYTNVIFKVQDPCFSLELCT